MIVLEPEGRVLRHHGWGLIPAWAKDPNVAHKLVNARSETVAEKPSFKRSFESKRCLVPADGFYEWKGQDPMRIVRPDRAPFAMAGLWETWEGRRTFTIVTTGPNELMKTIHGRMPVILRPDDEAAWLDPAASPRRSRPCWRPTRARSRPTRSPPRELDEGRRRGPHRACSGPADALLTPGPYAPGGRTVTLLQCRRMNGPLGLVLPGGGALCSWQGGALETLSKSLRFDKIVGVSAGALNGGAYFTGRLPEEMRHWRDADSIRALRLRPRLFPASVFSSDPAWELVSYAADDERARRDAICDLTVLSLRDHDRRTVYSRFTPKGARGWDGPLADRLVASCAIPLVYPRVRVGPHYYRDGGTAGVDGAHFLDLAGCETVVAIRPVRPDERGRRHWGRSRGASSRSERPT
ncbi:MAG: SOS response-associated peptidase family protein [Elusimicrobiota bacterium]|nr:MAG: SOS response-associated peptidase family protein [Elusimicrobiota bacterium]